MRNLAFLLIWFLFLTSFWISVDLVGQYAKARNFQACIKLLFWMLASAIISQMLFVFAIVPMFAPGSVPKLVTPPVPERRSD